MLPKKRPARALRRKNATDQIKTKANEADVVSISAKKKFTNRLT